MPTHRRQMSEAHGEAYGQGRRTGDVAPPFISHGDDTQHQLESCQELDAHALAGGDVAQLKKKKKRSPLVGF